MSRKTYGIQMLMLVLSASFIGAALSTMFLNYHFTYVQYQTLGSVCEKMIERHPESEQTILELLNTQENGRLCLDNQNILSSFGYGQADFLQNNLQFFVMAGLGLVIGILFFGMVILFWKKKLETRINMLTEYVEKVNTGKQESLLDTSEDIFSRLQDEIYKTITTLYQTREEAITAKKNFADNLSNIAHQLKTPITAISLSAQMMRRQCSSDYLTQIERQLYRLTYLEESLLLLSRIDAGTLAMKREQVDVLTVLTLAADNLQELFRKKGVFVEIPEGDAISIEADLEWTMEAMMNVLKNCMEHSLEGASVHCSYEKNPLYAQIQIWDEGEGFAKEDLSHVFERFYRGKNEIDTGVGIGLSLARAIIEMQNGCIRVFNLPQGGACFEIRFYSH